MTLQVVAADRLDVLADGLADALTTPMADPMAPEWIVVASAGVARWVRLHLADRLGSSGDGRTDGVAANIDLLYPGSFRRRLLAPGVDDDADPWHLDRLPWAVLDVLHAHAGDRILSAVATLPEGATWWGRARRIADLFDRYALHRPEMIRRWQDGDDVDGAGNALAEDDRWQPHLWRLIRRRIDRPSPAEELPGRIDALGAGAIPAEVPERVTLFGLTTIPGGAAFLDLLDAVGRHRDVTLHLYRPSPGMTTAVHAALDGPVTLRADDPTAAAIAHPLLRSWARPSREAEILLAGQATTGSTVEIAAPAPTTLLACVQRDLRRGVAPTADFVPAEDDRSIVFHSCHGETRQVEVLRDQILHLLADDPTLTEEDIVVVSPRIGDLAPFVESVFGPSAERRRGPVGGTAHVDGVGSDLEPAGGSPRLAYRITDRSLSSTAELPGAVASLLELVAGRFSVPALVDFLSSGPVRRRHGLDDDDIDRIAEWAEVAGVRWGLDGPHRERWKVPGSYADATWAAALERLVTGLAVSDDDDLPLAVGDVVPLGVEGSDIDVVGKLATVLDRLADLVATVGTARPIGEWVSVVRAACADLFAVDDHDRWQEVRLAESLAAVVTDAAAGPAPVDVPLTLGDLRRLLAERLGASAGRADFFRSGITFTSTTPLRGVPYRVVCLVGMDDGAFATGGVSGDDLIGATPHIGDGDRRADARQAVLEAVLAATDTVVVVRTGHDPVKNNDVPPAVVVAELTDTVAATVDPEAWPRVEPRLHRVHPRHAFDEANFAADAPWGFDRTALAGALSRAGEQVDAPPLVSEPLPVPVSDVVELSELRRFLDHPVRHFLTRGLGVQVATGDDLSANDGWDLVLALDGLGTWGVRDRLLRHRLAGGDADAFRARELAAGTLPVGSFGVELLSAADTWVQPLLDAVADRGVVWPPSKTVDIDVDLELSSRVFRVIGSVIDAGGDAPGPLRVTPSKPKAKRILAAWLDLLVLTVHDPGTVWCSTVLQRHDRKGDPVDITELRIAGADADGRRATALGALTTVVDLYRRGCAEPLPIFPELTPAVHTDPRKAAAAWGSRTGRYARGDSTDEWINFAFGTPDYGDLWRWAARSDDPPGLDDRRLVRYAEVLWGAHDASLARDDDEAGHGDGGS